MRVSATIGRLWGSVRRFFRRGSKGAAAEEMAAAPEVRPTPEQILAAEGYRLHRQIDEGGYGRVWMADVPGGDLRALKIVECKVGDKTAFERERRAMERVRTLTLNCEFLVPVEDLEVHEEHGFLSYTMPLADDMNGHPVADRAAYRPRTLDTELKKHGRLSVQECVTVTKRVLAALKVLHAKRLIHRDIKPGNVIYLEGKPVLADFGLATHEGIDVSQVSSPSNMPPEGVGAATGDLQAVGVLLYRLATGNPAERFPSPGTHIRDAEFPRLLRVFTMAGETDPSMRYINAQAMELALDWVLEKPPRKKRRDKVPKKSWLARLLASRQEKEADPPGMTRFKEHVRNIVEAGRLEAVAQSNPQRDYMDQASFSPVVGGVCLEFERRVGHEPPIVKAACLMAQAAMEPDKARREQFVKQAAAVSGGATGIAMVIAGIGMALGWSQGMIHAAIAAFVGVHLLGPIAWIVGGLTLTGVAGLLLFKKDNPKARAENAERVLISGVDEAIEHLWPKYGEQLSL